MSILNPQRQTNIYLIFGPPQVRLLPTSHLLIIDMQYKQQTEAISRKLKTSENILDRQYRGLMRPRYIYTN